MNLVGGFDICNLFVRKVMVCIVDEDLVGVMNFGGKLIYIVFDEDKKKVLEVGEFFIDLGMNVDEVCV